MKKLITQINLLIPTLIMISGLLLAGAEANPLEAQIIGSTSGIILFVIGGFWVGSICKKL